MATHLRGHPAGGRRHVVAGSRATFAALRLRALDMAMGGLLGSNLCDLVIIAADDLFYTHGSILANVSPVHAVTALSAAMMSGAVIVGLVYRPQQRILRTMSVVSVLLLACTWSTSTCFSSTASRALSGHRFHNIRNATAATRIGTVEPRSSPPAPMDSSAKPRLRSATPAGFDAASRTSPSAHGASSWVRQGRRPLRPLPS